MWTRGKQPVWPEGDGKDEVEEATASCVRMAPVRWDLGFNRSFGCCTDNSLGDDRDRKGEPSCYDLSKKWGWLEMVRDRETLGIVEGTAACRS